MKDTLMVFAVPLIQFHFDMTDPTNLPGPTHLDDLIVTLQLLSKYQDLQIATL